MSGVILVIDTSTPAVIAAVVRRGAGSGEAELLAERVTRDPRAHAECLTPNVLGSLADAAVQMDGLEAVVVGCGPGPFTGLRVGMATAAAYGHALDIPVHGVCSLDGIGGQTSGDVLVITDARRREVYWARYHDGRRTDGPAVAALADVGLEGVTAVAGSAEHAAQVGVPIVGPEYPSALELVAAVPNWGGEPEPLVPLYLRRPDAKTLAERGLK